METMDSIGSTNKMEIAQLLTDGKISLYFGEIDNLEEDKHLNAYIEVLKSTFRTVNLFLEDNIILETKKCIAGLEGIQKTTFLSNAFRYKIEREILHDISFLKALYFSENIEIILQSNRVKIVVSSDPVVIDIKIKPER
jgi:hypothetical protein